MKSILTSLFCLLILITTGQQKATLENGTKIIVFPDKTWVYESEYSPVEIKPDSAKVFIESSSLGTIYESPDYTGETYRSFPISDKYEAIDYKGRYFIIQAEGKIGYVIEFDVKDNEKKSKSIINKIVAKARTNNQNMLIRNAKIEDINSAGGVSFSIEWLNSSTKAIKYVYFTVVPYNRVDDIQSCRISGRSSFTGKVTGPIEPENPHKISYWENAWYNNTISCIEITTVKVEYMDGSSYVYIKEIPKILDKDFKNNCKDIN